MPKEAQLGDALVGAYQLPVGKVQKEALPTGTKIAFPPPTTQSRMPHTRFQR
jgi:hypothetical protein